MALAGKGPVMATEQKVNVESVRTRVNKAGLTVEQLREIYGGFSRPDLMMRARGRPDDRRGQGDPPRRSRAPRWSDHQRDVRRQHGFGRRAVDLIVRSTTR